MNLPIGQAQLALSRPRSDLICMERGRECCINTTRTTLNTNQPILLPMACVCLWQQRPVKWNRAHGLSLCGDLCLSNLKEPRGCEGQDVERRPLRSSADKHRHRQTKPGRLCCRPRRFSLQTQQLWGKSGAGIRARPRCFPLPFLLQHFLLLRLCCHCSAP